MRPLTLLVLAACSRNKVHGKVEGFSIPIQSSFLVYDTPAEGQTGSVVVAMSSLPNGCAVYQYWFGQVAKAKGDPKALAQGWANAFPEQFWEVILTFRTDGTSWPVAHTQWQGNAWDAPVTQPTQAGAKLIQHNAHRPAEWFEGLQGYEQDYYSNAGVVRFGGSVPQQRISGKFQTLTVDETGLSTGPVKIAFNATPCPKLDVDTVLLTGAEDTGAPIDTGGGP